MTATSVDDHIFVGFENDIIIFIVIEETEGEELTGDAAGQVDAVDAVGGEGHLVDDALDGGVIGGSLTLTQREGAPPRAAVGVVTVGCDDPVGPADRFEVDVELLTSAA